MNTKELEWFSKTYGTPVAGQWTQSMKFSHIDSIVAEIDDNQSIEAQSLDPQPETEQNDQLK